MSAEIARERCGEGSLQEKQGIYNIVLGYKIIYDDGKKTYKYKWFATGLSVKGNHLRKAKQMLSFANINFNPYKLDLSLDELINGPSNLNIKPVAAVVPAEQMPEPCPIPVATEEKQKAIENDILFSNYMAQWLNEIRKNVEKSTFSAYKMNVEKKVIPYFQEKGIYLNQLTSNDVHTFYKKMRNDGLKAESVRRIHANIRKALVDAATDEILKTNILSTLKRPFKPNVEEFRASFYSLDEVNELLRACNGHRLEVPIKLAAFYGFRREEVVGLRWSDIDFDEGSITINNTILQCYLDGEYQMVEKERAKSQSSLRSLPLDDEIKEMLLRHKAQIEANKKEYKKSYSRQRMNYICVDSFGELIKPAYITKNFKRILNDNGLRPIRFHELRHTCAAVLISRGVPLRVVQEHMGHSTYATTEKYYGHLDKSAKRLSVKVMSEAGMNISSSKEQEKDNGKK